jgi:ribosome recycling factor
MFNTTQYQDRMRQTFAHFEDELKKVRTGRAHPAMLEGVMVEVYGTNMPLNQVANVLAVESQLLQITPFDQNNLKSIVEAIRADQSLGLNPSDDGRVVRVPIPPLTEERRRQMTKQLGDRAEDCRISLRNIRHDALKDAKTQKDAKQLSEDEVKRIEKSLDGLMSDFQTKIDIAIKAKEQEIMTI